MYTKCIILSTLLYRYNIYFFNDDFNNDLFIIYNISYIKLI